MSGSEQIIFLQDLCGKGVEEKLQWLMRHEELTKILSTKISPSKVKSDTQSESSRNEGNKLFQAGRFKDAIFKFSAAALVATFEENRTDGTKISKAFALALANRSLSLLKLNQYEAAINDVDLALDSGYPKENAHKLLERKAKCLIHLGKNVDARETLTRALESLEYSKIINEAERKRLISNIEKELKNVNATDVEHKDNGKFEPSFNSNEDVPAFSSDVKICFSEEKGRFGVATRDLYPGDFVLKEAPLASVLKHQFREQYCDQCMKRVQWCPVPCPRCCQVIFCSKSCRQSISRGILEHMKATKG